jgi:chemotaxis protein methyltransferase CheR
MAFTFFFRDTHTLEQVCKYFIPYISGFRKIKIWDAGCAMGQEPYTFAIILAERMSYFGFKNVQLDVSDLDETDCFGKIVNEGVYHYNELKRIPEDIFQKYFSIYDDNENYKISETIKSKLSFTKHDLLTLQPFSNNYHLIICKNVLLHFQPDERVKVIKMFHSVLEPGGMFTTEQTQQLPEECKHLFTQIAADANVYQKIG